MDLLQIYGADQMSRDDHDRLDEWVRDIREKLDRLRGDEPEAVEDVDENHLGMICRTSVEYAQSYIQDANLATLRAALDTERSSGQARGTLVRSLEAQIRKRETVNVSGKQQEIDD